MKMKNLLGFFALGMLAVPTVQADVVNFKLEPYAGYSLLGSMSQTNGTVTTNFGSSYGLGIGARAALAFADIFWAGVDGSYFPSQGQTQATGTNADIFFNKGSNLLRVGAVAGVDLPVLPFRFWVGYDFINRMSESVATVGAVTGAISMDGGSLKIGAGFKVLPILSINAEYFFTSFGSTNVAGTIQNLASGRNITQTSLFLSASVPLSF